MSLAFRLFPPGNPPDDADRFIFTRADVTSSTGFSNYLVTWAELKAAIGAVSGTPGRDGIVLIAEPEIEDQVPTLGIKGDPGVDGITTINSTTTMIVLEGESPEDVIPMPGIKGDTGAPGLITNNTQILLLHDEIIEDQIPLQGPKGDVGAAGTPSSSSASTPALFQEENYDDSSILAPAAVVPREIFLGAYNPGVTVIVDGHYAVMAKELRLTGIDVLTLLGDAELVVI